MPIAAMGEAYSEEHWRRVKNVLQRAIQKAGMTPKVVWENPEIDVIQSAILKNLYENDVIICDLSGLNPNVMLEAGLRLSTKKPTVIVTDRVERPPFDVSTIGYIDYQKDLEFNSTDSFINKLSQKIQDVSNAHEAGQYKYFVENFTFETIEPTTVTVTQDKYILERLTELSHSVSRIERAQRSSAPLSNIRDSEAHHTPNPIIAKFRVTEINSEEATDLEILIDGTSGCFCTFDAHEDGYYLFDIYRHESSNETSRVLRKNIMDVILNFKNEHGYTTKIG